MGQDTIYDRAKRQVELQLKQAENEHRRNMLKKRLEFLTSGVKALRSKRPAEAVLNFKSYVKLMEDWKGVAEGGLTPSNFDFTKDMGDLLMMSGIYWDLAKIYDFLDTPDKRREFLHYLEKFILFSKGMTWQPLCAETLRKYLLTDRPRHRKEFKNAYKIIGSAKCFIVTSLMEETELETLPILWRFRDEVLSKRWLGRAFIRTYYVFGPSIAFGLDHAPAAIRKKMGKIVDHLAKRLN